jgi:hypothetical protein
MQNVQQILKDEELDKRLLKEGYVVIPFLNKTEVLALVDFYNQNHPQQLEGMYATAHVTDIDFRVKMNAFIKTVFENAIERTFANCNPLGASFIAKGKGSKGTLSPHQDWNIVDEDIYRSFNIWVPLVDVDEQNGTIKILPGSHLWLRNFRSANISSSFNNVNELLWPKMIALLMAKGEALIYDHRLLHASGENFTDKTRLTAVYGIIPAGAEMRYYHKADEHTVEVFESNPEFFLYGNIFEGPKGLKSIKKFDFTFPEIDAGTLAALMGEKPGPIATNNSPLPFFAKIRKLLNV